MLLVLTGLIHKMGFRIGAYQMQAMSENPKGFFETVPMYHHNNEIMELQNVTHLTNTHKYEADKGVVSLLNSQWAMYNLPFLNNPENFPWLIKDPRLCITLGTWLAVMPFQPAIVFTYRHPLDVALSLYRRNQETLLGIGLRLWYVYNKRAIIQSSHLCRVVTSYIQILNDPVGEVNRIHSELKETCGVPVPKAADPADVKSFVTSSLQHGKVAYEENTACSGELLSFQTIFPPNSFGWDNISPEDLSVYRSSMILYCALVDRSAFSSSFAFDEGIKNE